MECLNSRIVLNLNNKSQITNIKPIPMTKIQIQNGWVIEYWNLRFSYIAEIPKRLNNLQKLKLSV
jgi:hypothetical protein